MTTERRNPDKTTSDFLSGRWGADFDRSPFRNQPRVEFLRAIQRKAAFVLDAIRDELLPFFRTCAQEQKIDLLVFNNFALRPAIGSNYHALCRQMRARVYSLLAKFHLPDRPLPSEWSLSSRRSTELLAAPPLFEPRFFVDWVIPIVIDTLGAWAAEPRRRAREWRTDGIAEEWIMHGLPSPIQFVAGAWLPLRESKRKYLQRVSKEFQDFLNQHVDKTEAELTAVPKIALPKLLQQSPRLKSLVRKLNARAKPEFERLSDRFTLRHFDWLVMYQVLGCQNFSRIAHEYQATTPQTVMKGVRQAAEMVVGPRFSQWLLPPRRGRPKK